MTTCPTHQNTTPPAPVRPHNTRRAAQRCKGCGAFAGSPEEFRSHHCPCCGEYFDSSCTARRKSCQRCGVLDTSTLQWHPHPDPMADLLTGRAALSPWLEAWNRAAVCFGTQVAHYLRQVTTEIDQTHLYGEIAFKGAVLTIRYANGWFDAASPCPLREQCRRGRLWSPVHGRQGLLDVHLNGPGPDADECDRARLHHGRGDG